MDTNENQKPTENNENECPSASKRFKSSSKHIKFINEDEDRSVLEEMGIEMIESDESSSSTSESATPKSRSCSNNNDENSNESPQLNDKLTSETNALNNDESNTNNTETNETLIKSNNKSSNTSIEIFVDNKLTDKTHKKIEIESSSVQYKGRSPLALVTCNNNYNNINQNNSLGDTIKKQSVSTNDSFFLCRNRLSGGKDQFKKLADEVILQIFKWLPKKALIRCSSVCRRFNQLVLDESLWTRMDLGGKFLRAGALQTILSRGVVILRLSQTELRHPIFEPNGIVSQPEFQSKLQYLDLSMAVISKSSLKMLLSKCRKLKKLSLEHIQISDEICSEIAKNVNLEALNLSMCEGIESWSVKIMMSKLQKLQSLNISWTSLSVESVQALVENITPNVWRLNIAGCKKTLFNSHLETLSKRCPGLLELDLSDCTALTTDAIRLVFAFKDLEYLSLSRCYNISASSYAHLNRLTSLLYLDVFGLLSDTALESLQSSLRSVGVNKFIYSSVARPTVGTRRTSIWGLRTRD